MPLDMLDDLGCIEIINTDENETVNTVDKSGVLDAAANVCEKQEKRDIFHGKFLSIN